LKAFCLNSIIKSGRYRIRTYDLRPVKAAL
jgi:hypothetical protein